MTNAIYCFIVFSTDKLEQLNAAQLQSNKKKEQIIDYLFIYFLNK